MNGPTTWEEKLSVLQAISNVALRMRAIGDWYVDSNMAIAGGGTVQGGYGNGATPQEAVEKHWDLYVTNLPKDRFIDVGTKQYQRFSDFVWVPREAKKS